MTALVFSLSLLFAAPKPAALPAAQAKKAHEFETQSQNFQREGKYFEAEAPLLAAIAIRTKYLGADDLDVLNDQGSLAVSYRRRGEAAKAVPILTKVVEGFRKSKDPEAPQLTRNALNNLAAAYRSDNQEEKARDTWASLVAELEKGPMTEELARVLDNLAAQMSDLGDFAGAEKYSVRGAAAWLALRGAEDPDYAISLVTLANLQGARGSFKEARGNLTKAIQIFAKARGAGHPELASFYNVLGTTEYRAKDLAASKKAFEKSLSISRMTLPEDHPSVQDARAGLEVLNQSKH